MLTFAAMKRRNMLFALVVVWCSIVGSVKAQATRDDNMAMGNPSGAVTDFSARENYLIVRPQYTLSYNARKGTANWVSWHLSTAWKGDYRRRDLFSTDAAIPEQWYRVKTKDYTNSGFNRGHLCPSDDRDASRRDNEATFQMTNIIPQSPACNQRTWHDLERYCTELALAGNELYIVAGPHGKRGQGSNGTATAIAAGKVRVPKYVWKAILILPNGCDDITRVNTSTKVIAVIMPNRENVNTKEWFEYCVTVDALEKLTGYDLFSNVPDDIEDVIEGRVTSTGD